MIITSSNGANILILLSAILIFPWVLCFVAQEAQPPSTPLSFVDQRLVVAYPIIQTFKNTITSDPFNITQTWVGPNICNYTGFYCDNPPDNISAIAVSAVDFNGYQLSAPTLDGFIDQLPDLAFFHANSNNFSGTLSPKIANLRYFYELDISNNNFFGNFPASILIISTLTFLDIRFNSFSGSVPSQVFSQTFDVLFLNDNNFMQTLPPNLGSIPSHYLALANNKFRGPIPRAIFNPSSRITEILLLNNLLTGCIPYEIGFLTEVTVFDAGINLLTGPLPWSLGCLAKIELLNLAGNLLYGQVPEAVCGLGNLGNLSLSGNYFTGIGPLCWNLMKRGILDVRKNCIPGLPDQRSVDECILFFMHPRSWPRHPPPFSYFPCKVVPPRTEHPRIGT